MFTDIEQALVERLKAEMPNVHVLTATELSEVDEARQPTPAVHVIYNGYRTLPNARTDGKATQVSQTWLTVIAVRNVRKRGTGEAAREDAVALCEQVAGSLMGFRPQSAAGPLTLTNAPRSGASNGFTYVPLAFAVDTVLKAAN
ncbi:Gp37 family protein [Thalassolituus oleivorans]|uniref:Gp37 family protein n=1 Tax=Thalassolituus oleivorans TaxID=187493 RepID=UPI0023F28453|nr:Gp37 family protein [Thalassolituus oleivorans]